MSPCPRSSASSFANVVGANDRVQIGVIGTGGRATQLMDHLIRTRSRVEGDSRSAANKMWQHGSHSDCHMARGNLGGRVGV